jgi:UDP-N-acetylglucosamine 2-epimerase (non-hydrolysing)
MACTLVASKLGVKVAHVEAGLRSGDRSMPEEINRLVTDAIADLLLTPSADADENLRREGVPEVKIRMVGNIMIDALVDNLDRARQRDTLRRLRLEERRFVYVTLHRPSNVDQKDSLAVILSELVRLSRDLPVVFPMHPRTRKMAAEFGIPLPEGGGMRLLEPVGYHDSLCLTQGARFVLTDSGGLQEESTYFRTPCLTLRPNTERPITIQVGSNRLTAVDRLRQDIADVLAREPRIGSAPPGWDGKTAGRVIQAILAASI